MLFERMGIDAAKTLNLFNLHTFFNKVCVNVLQIIQYIIFKCLQFKVCKSNI